MHGASPAERRCACTATVGAHAGSIRSTPRTLAIALDLNRA